MVYVHLCTVQIGARLGTWYVPAQHSSCSRRNALSPPSPYSSGMLMSKIPMREYAISSARVVCLDAAQDILSARLLFFRSCPLSTSWGILVMADMVSSKVVLLPRYSQSQLKNSTTFGANSSCNVQPRVNQRPPPSSDRDCTSSRYVWHTVDFLYQAHMELIASVSSALLLLSIQNRSTLATTWKRLVPSRDL